MADEKETYVNYLLTCIQNMFLACGYNTSDVIAEMDVSQSAEVNA